MVMLCVMVAVIFALVISRYIFSYSFIWVEELTRFLLIWLTFLGAATLILQREHIRMDFIYLRMPMVFRRIVQVIYTIIELGVLYILIVQGLKYSESVGVMDSPALGVSMSWPAMAIAFCSILMAVFVAFHLIDTMLGFFGIPTAREKSVV